MVQKQSGTGVDDSEIASPVLPSEEAAGCCVGACGRWRQPGSSDPWLRTCDVAFGVGAGCSAFGAVLELESNVHLLPI